MLDKNDRSDLIDLAHVGNFRLGELTVSPSTREVSRGENREVLEPRVMQVLVALWQARERVVSRDDLIVRCWDRRVVGDPAINRAISQLRKLSEADGGVNFSIETIPRVGYRLTRAPETAPPGPEAWHEAERPMLQRHWAASRLLWSVPAVILVAFAGLWLLRDRLPWAPEAHQAQVAVLPFDTAGPGKELRGFADRLADEIVGQLSDIQIQAVSPTQSKALRSGDAGAIDRLGADMVLDGTVQGDAKTIDVRVHLDDVREHVVLWSGEYHGAAEATEALQARVVVQAADVLYWAKTGRSGKVRLDAASLAAFIAGRENTTAVRDYSPDAAEADYRKVIAASPDFSWGHSAVAAMEEFELREDPARRGGDALRADARRETKRALALEPKNGEAWMALEYSVPLSDWRGREALLIQGIAADSDFEPIITMEGRLLWGVGRGHEALPWFQRAHAVDPLRNGDTRMLALSLAYNGRLAESRAVIAKMELQWPDHLSTKDAHFWTGVIAGATNDVLTQLADPAARPVEFNQTSVDAWRATLKANASNEATSKTEAKNKVMNAADAGSLSHGEALTLLAMLGDLDGAFAQAALYEPANPSAPPYLFLPATAAMRSDPRFIPLARKLGFVAYWQSSDRWPDFCSEPGLPYDCRGEAAKVVTNNPN